MSEQKQIVAIASDHAGYEMKTALREEISSLGYGVLDLGTDGPDSVDYPDFAHALAEAIIKGLAERGVLVCGSGIGVSITANRHPGIRASLCHNVETARLSRQHNDANVLALGGRIVGIEVARNCLKTFLETEFEGGRHARRVAKMG
ncbi:MAG: ribose 5-phosphate isomerase B [Alphaproteobacteria bacterium]|jgi:ribose 5-phosphate isomerase B|nr:ribose 5-phosphate isomerase B [Alphaproteobacteria bacterium]MDP7456904.1 ribose 5-phosphate isomerase B [Alphaproteobacteria bacterium]HJO88460.1 ribose 5-phosphate isomerase B [Alphaproteobacteria bacterium]|tara:strand:- start:822 stop:1262 length:441 start_codon:yes stop_codon:yes gene_type:complete